MGWSYSSYSALRKCGQYYKLSYLDKIPQEPNVNFEFGTAMHKGLYNLLQGQDGFASFNEYWDKVKWMNIEYQRHNWDMLSEMGYKFINTFTKKYAHNMQVVTAEKRMYANYRNIEFEGTPDALVTWNEKQVLIDYKTSAYNYGIEKTITSLQLYLYSFLLEQNGYKVDSICYFVFNKGTGSIQTPVIFDIDKKVRDGMLLDMSEYILANRFDTSKNPINCVNGSFTCPYFNSCYSAKDEVTTNDIRK